MCSNWKWEILAGHQTIKLGLQMAGHNKSFQSLVFVLTQLHSSQWSSLPFSMPSLIVQWPARIFCFYLLCMIVKSGLLRLCHNTCWGYLFQRERGEKAREYSLWFCSNWSNSYWRKRLSWSTENPWDSAQDINTVSVQNWFIRDYWIKEMPHLLGLELLWK